VIAPNLRESEEVRIAGDESPESGGGMKIRGWRMALGLVGAVVAIIGLVWSGMGKKDTTFDGVLVRSLMTFEFYSGQKGCEFNDPPYWVVPNEKLYAAVGTTKGVDLNNPGAELMGTWKAKIRGNLSRTGQWGARGNYTRKLEILEVLEAIPISCGKKKVEKGTEEKKDGAEKKEP